jgi:hypothetical protein
MSAGDFDQSAPLGNDFAASKIAPKKDFGN